MKTMQEGLAEILTRSPVMPVLTIEDAHDAVPIAQALAAGGIAAVEITLRTPAGLAAIRAIAAGAPDIVVGAGTVLSPTAYAAAAEAGARFCVAPGATPALSAFAKGSSAVFLPGAATASEAMVLLEAGYALQKFFPAAQAGGTALLSAWAAPLPDIRFCPTGGITAATAPDYLKLPNVVCVGGSWLVPKEAVKAKDWRRITALAAEAAALR
jgi:2-dehydro-3-deoxyphosphogluconate aldolase / (4S)-4-hydroxy-2-oxoglutarate aldolase